MELGAGSWMRGEHSMSAFFCLGGWIRSIVVGTDGEGETETKALGLRRRWRLYKLCGGTVLVSPNSCLFDRCDAIPAALAE